MTSTTAKNMESTVRRVEDAGQDSFQAREDYLCAYQHRLEDFEKELMIRQKELDRREEAMDAVQFPGALSHGAYMKQRDWCHRECARNSWCVDSFGTKLHKHHSCEVCHRAWKQGLPKGLGKGFASHRPVV